MTVHGCDTVCNPQLRAKRLRECRGKLCVNRNGLLPKSRVFSIVPDFTQEHNLGVYNNCVDTVERAFTERFFLCKSKSGFRPALPVSPSRFRDDHCFSEFRAWTLGFMPHLPVLDYDQTVALFPAQKRRVYEEALISLSTDGAVRAKDAELSSFVKFEKQDVGKPPRVINPRSARFNLEVARYLKHAEHHYFKSMHKAFGALWGGDDPSNCTVFKGLDADGAASELRLKWDCFDDPVAIGCDATKFDMHVSIPALRFEHSFYNDYWKRRALRWLLRQQLYNKGKARCRDGTVEFEMAGTRSSGDINTSLGNCIIMCAIVWAWSLKYHVRLQLANNGDDCVIIMDRKDLVKLQETFEEWCVGCGFEVVLEDPVYEFEQIEFCQTQPVELSSGWRMVRNPFTCFRKDTMCLRPMPDDKTYRRWLYAVGEAGKSLCAGVPVLSSFYSMFERNGVKSERFKNMVSPYRFASKSMRLAEVNSRARASFAMAFGITPGEQEEMELLFDGSSIGELDLSPIDRDCVEFGLPGAQILRQDIYTQL